MECKVSELVKRGHLLASEVSDTSIEMLRSSIASMISDLATQLDVQLARSNALAAENAVLLAIMNEQAGSFSAALAEGFHDAVMESGSNQLIDIYQRRLQPAIQCIPPTPATDAFLAEVRAQGVEEFLRDSQLPYQIATVLADYDSVDDATLQTVIWSGQPPEPDGDVWHLEYVSRGNAIVRAVLKELRKGVQS